MYVVDPLASTRPEYPKLMFNILAKNSIWHPLYPTYYKAFDVRLNEEYELWGIAAFFAYPYTDTKTFPQIYMPPNTYRAYTHTCEDGDFVWIYLGPTHWYLDDPTSTGLTHSLEMSKSNANVHLEKIATDLEARGWSVITEGQEKNDNN